MAPIPIKTYSKKGSALQGSCENEDQNKENFDPFDELLSSPLKQDVQFKPLSYWEKRKLEELNSKKKFSGKKKCGLYDLSDSDDSPSSNQRKKKSSWEHMEVRNRKKNSNTQPLKKIDINSSICNSTITLDKSIPCSISNNKKSDLSHKSQECFKFVTVRRPCTNRKWGCIYSDMNESSQGCSGEKKNFAEKNKSRRSIDLENKLSKFIEKKQCKENFNCLELKQQDGTYLNSETYILSPLLDCTLVQKDSLTTVSSVESISEDNPTVFLEDTLTENISVVKFEENCLGKTFVVSRQWQNETNNDEELYKTRETNFESFDEQLESLNDSEEKLSDKSDSFHSCNLSHLETMMSDMTITNTTLLDTSVKNISPKCSTEETSVMGDGNSVQETHLLPEGTKKDSVEDPSFHNVNTRRIYKNKWKKPPETDDVNEVSEKLENVTVTEETLEKSAKRCTLSKKCKADETKHEKSLRNRNIQVSMSTKSSSNVGNNTSLNVSHFTSFNFTRPIFHSTIIQDDDEGDKTTGQNAGGNPKLEITDPCIENSAIALKSGKKWLKSISVLRQLQRGSIAVDNLDRSAVKGRKFRNFVQEVAELQNDVSGAFERTLANGSFQNVERNTIQAEGCDEDSFGIESVLQIQMDDSLKEDVLSSASDSKMSSSVLMGHTVKLLPNETLIGNSSEFRSALGIENDVSVEGTTIIWNDSAKEQSSVISARDFILAQCGQTEVLEFEEYFNERTLINCKKIGEGVYGEVFMCNSDTVIKIIPIEGADEVNGEPQKKFEEILSEIVIASKLSNLRKGEKYRTSGFSEMKRCWCVVGKYPKYLLDLWDEYDRSGSGSENDSPIMFKPDQQYVILELANGGKDLESFVFNSSEQSLSIFVQTAASLAAAEKAFEFEHRDLHWGNLLIAPTKDKFMTVVLDDVEYKIATKGVKVSIIDFTLSRISHEGCCIFNDLSVDPGLFEAHGDYQFEIYRLMQREVKNDWSLFKPKNNLYWLHYVIDKMIKMVRYKNKNTQVHKKFLKELKILESVVLEHDDSMDLILTQGLV